MPKRLLFVWGAFDALYLGAALTAIIFTVIWKNKNGTINDDNEIATVRALLMNDTQLTAGLSLGIVMAVSWASSLLALAFSLRRGTTKLWGLKLFNFSLVFVMILTLVIGSSIWIITLQERATFASIWSAQSSTVKGMIQESFECCGYFNATSEGLFSVNEGFCANPGPDTPSCVTPLTNLANTTYTDIFTVIYGFGGIQLCLFLATACLVNVRYVEERYRKISAKRGRTII